MALYQGTTFSLIVKAYGFVSGHDFSRAVKAQTDLGFSPCMNPFSKHSPAGWKSASIFTTYAFVSGHDFSRAVQAANDEGFSPCGAFSLSIGLRATFNSSPW
jgi:hypothetical protein